MIPLEKLAWFRRLHNTVGTTTISPFVAKTIVERLLEQEATIEGLENDIEDLQSELLAKDEEIAELQIEKNDLEFRYSGRYRS